MGDGEGGEGCEEECGVGGLDVLVYVGGCLLEDEGPEVGDFRGCLSAGFVEGSEDGDLFLGWGELSAFHLKGSKENELISRSASSKVRSIAARSS